MGETGESRMKWANSIVENLVESVYNCLYIQVRTAVLTKFTHCLLYKHCGI
ncbi:hypothetical protein ANACOL_03493 [Anaerotruncus colihominis DSM 17241]|uniref:Uncharacterized protein n=1 Tax=Anaerotruncus colihominis DSM 17241 TaxID=445972 RepID=B0PFB3_9FIRM|nr:hypothetical protein ANACOL_03493 [Anaerotruncus colihominis DSM 17241]